MNPTWLELLLALAACGLCYALGWVSGHQWERRELLIQLPITEEERRRARGDWS